MNVLVTGGAGYIGSHAALRLLADGHAVTVIDDLSRGNPGAIDVLQSAGDVPFVEADIGDGEAVVELLRHHRTDVVMHFAALAEVGESVRIPLRYYRNNLAGTVSLLEAMEVCGVDRLVFSSTCATYGAPAPEHIPMTEDCPQQPVNPYGRCKLAVEQMLYDQLRARTDRFAFAALRYFNVAGCDEQGRLGEDHDPETHLIPICLDAALGRREAVTIFGTDYETPDGTCIRDYIHVDDLVDAHVAVMEALQPGRPLAYNLGIGAGHSVREVIDACRGVTGVEFPVREGARRPGDPPVLYADPERIRRDLGWSAQRTNLDNIIDTAWHWHRTHPDGY
ncbi:MAG: UDP-glucose 4-epimerase GalE [Planctomycetota bacterium]|jgi:UDP-glucose 4-epimerase